MLQAFQAPGVGSIHEPPPTEANGNVASADQTPARKKGDDPATGPRLSDLWVKLANFLLKARFFLYVMIKGTSIDKPYYVHYQITRRCNFRCPSCRTWQDESYSKGLTLDEIKEMARNMRRVGVRCVALTGGEATLRKDVVQVVKAFRDEGLLVRLQTNGFLLTEGLMERLFRAGVADVFISYDSAEIDAFNKINGVKGAVSYERVSNAVRIAAKMAPRFGAGVFLTAVLRKDNVREIVPLHEFAKDIGALIGYFALEVANEGDPMNIRANDPALRERGEDRRVLENAFKSLIDLKRAKGNVLSVSERLLGDFVKYYNDPDGDMHWNCRAGRMYMAILPEGTICVCNGTPPIPGYTYKNLPELYADPNRETIFNKFRTTCDGCICMRQLEYITEDRKDLFDKGVSFARAMFGLQ